MGTLRQAGRPGRTLLVLLLLAAVLSLGAKKDLEDFKKKVRETLRLPNDEESLPVEELFQKAEEYHNGHVNWYGRIVAKIAGENSAAFEKMPLVKTKNVSRARTLYQKVADNYPFSKYAPLAELRVADCHFELEQYEEAAVWYEQFVKRHQKREEVPYAMYKQAMCSFERMRKSGRDPEQAKNALALFNLLIELYPQSGEAKVAEEKAFECKERLAEGEMKVGHFYFKRHDYWAAAARFNGVWQGYSGVGFDAEAKFMEAQCYDKLGKRDLAGPMYQAVIDQHPTTDWAEKAAEKKAKL